MLKPFQLTHQISLHTIEYFHLGVDILEPLLVTIIILVDFVCSYQVHNLVLVLDRVNPPILDDERQLVHFLLGLFISLVVVEYISHDGNKHVEQMDTHKEAHESEENHECWSHAVVQVQVCIELSQG